ncbi:hypothetical protein [Bacillus altitudinis]|uniref:hypothetical protein n=1 Tax=Bacillus altitudinis TaxID=293387 RepID=UPI000932ED5D|nr:hypothetical protein [Bacillus altitudinis]OJT54522.1 hypothetical protein BFP48_16050 [Bacillus altitudinis]
MAEAEQILKAIQELSIHLKEIECNIVEFSDEVKNEFSDEVKNEFSDEVKNEFNQINKKLDRQIATYMNV